MLSLSSKFALLLDHLAVVFTVILVSFLCFFIVLIIDSLIRKRHTSRYGAILLQDLSLSRHWLFRCFRTAFLSVAVLGISLITTSIRRSFTDASSFSFSQSLWHALFSVINIHLTLALNKFVCGNSLHELYWPRSTVGWISLSNAKKPCVIKRKGHPFSIKFITIFLIVVGTHSITPLLFSLFRCFNGFDCVPYVSGTLLRGILFFVVQQLWLFVNGVDEETSWRGFVRVLFEKENKADGHVGHSPIVMYLVSGSVYALCHSLNQSFDSLSMGIMYFNLICEGAVWMFLFKKTDDLCLNWILHHVDDLASIWFGTSSLAAYALPEGQICPWNVGDCNQFINGGEFGIGASLLYIGQNLWTLIVILVLNQSYFRFKPKGSLHQYKSSQTLNDGPFSFENGD
ncbi:hypothetical protein GEMRC1_013576 [Eukaryota sp. GEM-RC1]